MIAVPLLTNEQIDRVMSEIQNPTDLLTSICAQAKLANAAPDAPPADEPVALPDEHIIGLIVNQCDTLDITRVNEQKGGQWHATTIFDGDDALLRVFKKVADALRRGAK